MLSNHLSGLPTRPAPSKQPSGHPAPKPEIPAPGPADFSIIRYEYHKGEPGGAGPHAAAHYAPIGRPGADAPPVPLESIPRDSLAGWDKPFTARVGLGHPDPFGRPGSDSIFGEPPRGVLVGEGPAFGFKGDPPELPPVPVAHSPAQARDYADLQRWNQGGHLNTRLTPEQVVNGMRVADFMEDTATVQAGRAWLLKHASPSALESARPFLDGLDAVKVPDPDAAKAFGRAYSRIFPGAAPICARESAELSAVLFANLGESPDALRKNPSRLARIANREILERFDRHRDPLRAAFPPADTVSTSHERLRRDFPGAPPDLLLAASMHHAHATMSLAPSARMAEHEAIRDGLDRLKPEHAQAFTAYRQGLRKGPTRYAGFVHPLEYELRGLPDQMARAAKPQLPYSQGGGLSDAAIHGDYERAELLVREGVRRRGPAAVVAAWQADVPMLELLTRDATLEPAQLQAAWRAVEVHGDPGTARFLLGKGAIPGLRPPPGSSEPRSPREISFVRMAERGHTEVAGMLLDDEIGGLARRQGFLGAAQGGHVGVLGLLLDGTTTERRDQAAYVAVAHGHADAARLIRDAGLSVGGRERALELAERNGNAEMAGLFRE